MLEKWLQLLGFIIVGCFLVLEFIWNLFLLPVWGLHMVSPLLSEPDISTGSAQCTPHSTNWWHWIHNIFCFCRVKLSPRFIASLVIQCISPQYSLLYWTLLLVVERRSVDRIVFVFTAMQFTVVQLSAMQCRWIFFFLLHCNEWCIALNSALQWIVHWNE